MDIKQLADEVNNKVIKKLLPLIEEVKALKQELANTKEAMKNLHCIVLDLEQRVEKNFIPWELRTNPVKPVSNQGLVQEKGNEVGNDNFYLDIE